VFVLETDTIELESKRIPVIIITFKLAVKNSFPIEKSEARKIKDNSMSDNVIILGAGASFATGIPLMAGFVEKMWEFATRKQVNGKPMSQNDIDTFQKAIKIRNELDSYHGRALYNDRNLEDILSILTFDEMLQSKRKKDKLLWFTKAISRTIELTCSVKHDGNNSLQELSRGEYRLFWNHILYNYVRRNIKIPVIISLNYDLVLERALFHCLIGTNLRLSKLSIDGIEIGYHYDPVGDFQYVVEQAKFDIGEDVEREEVGTILEKGHVENSIRVEILKLHGSLNFPKRKMEEPQLLVRPVEEPFILPPIINKMSSAKSITKMWGIALQRLRSAKNVIIVGYSMPWTDIYMQYFLKTALGPNLDLNRIHVFDPVLYRNDATSQEMKERYAACFSPQLQNRIVFRHQQRGNIEKGTFEHFVKLLGSSDILF